MLYMDAWGNVKPKGRGRGGSGLGASRGGNRGGRGRGRGPRGARGRGRGRGRPVDFQYTPYGGAVDFQNAWSPSLAPSSRGRGRSSPQGNQSVSPASSTADVSGADIQAPPFSTFTQRSNAATNIVGSAQPTNQKHVNAVPHSVSNGGQQLEGASVPSATPTDTRSKGGVQGQPTPGGASVQG